MAMIGPELKGLSIPDFTIEGIQGSCSPIARISPYSRIGMFITVWNQYARQNETLLKIVGERRKVCEVSLEILDFGSMIQCHTGWLLAYFVGIEGITLAMFLPAIRKIETY